MGILTWQSGKLTCQCDKPCHPKPLPPLPQFFLVLPLYFLFMRFYKVNTRLFSLPQWFATFVQRLRLLVQFNTFTCISLHDTLVQVIILQYTVLDIAESWGKVWIGDGAIGPHRGGHNSSFVLHLLGFTCSTIFKSVFTHTARTYFQYSRHDEPASSNLSMYTA